MYRNAVKLRWNFSKKNLICALGEHFRRYAHALRFVIGLHGTQKFHSIIKYKDYHHYQILIGARASLKFLTVLSQEFQKAGCKFNEMRWRTSWPIKKID